MIKKKLPDFHPISDDKWAAKYQKQAQERDYKELDSLEPKGPLTGKMLLKLAEEKQGTNEPSQRR